MIRGRYGMASLAALAVAALLAAAYRNAYSQAGKQPTQPANGSPQSLNVRYAKACLALAKLELQKAQRANTRVPGTLPAVVTEPLRAAVAIAQAQLDYARSGKAEALHDLQVAIMQAELRLAEDQLQWAVAINQQSPTTVSNSEVELRRARVEVARLAVKKARAASSQTAIEDLQGQIGELQKEILEIHSRLVQLSLLG